MDELRALPDGFADTVAALHLVAERIVAPARKPDNEIALQPTPGGFGTPSFDFGGAPHRVRVEGTDLVHEEGAAERRAPLSSLAAAVEAVEELLPTGEELDTAPLAVDPAASLALATFYAFADATLARLIAEAEPGDDASPARLWPEHFDLAIELGDEGAGARANYGASPGDEHHPEPYLYVGPWSAAVEGELWQATGFEGAELGYAELLAAPDQAAAAIEFFRSRRDELNEIPRRAR
ncbi:MAG TPA: hypothetical protein VH703_01730 [Solirubrobacterales bacterium]|jgi:hypothetical protein